MTAAERYKTGFARFHRAFPDLRITVDALIAEGDLVAFHTTLHGTHHGVLHGPGWPPVPPTGKSATWTVSGFRRMRDGKLVEGFATWDWLSFLEQLAATISIGSIALPPRTVQPQRPPRPRRLTPVYL